MFNYNQVLSSLKNKTGINIPYFVKNSTWIGFKNIFTIGFGLLTMTLVARLVPKEIYGQYQFILTIVALFSITAIPGLNSSVIQSVANKFDGSYKEAVKTSFLWSLIGSFSLICLGLYWHFFQHSPLGIPIMIASVFFSFLYAPNTWESFLQGKAKFKITAKYITIRTITFSSLFIATIYFFPSNLTLITSCHLVVNSVLSVVLYKKSLGYVQNKKIDKNTIPYGFFMTKISILGLIAAHLDKIIIAIFIGPIELAVYAMGVNLIKKITELLKSFMATTTPIVSRKNTLLKKNYLLLFSMSLAISCVLYFTLPFLVTLIFSDKYSEAIPITRAIVLFLPFFATGVLYKNHFIFFIKNKKILFLESLISPSIRIILVLILSFYLGLTGLALAFGLQYLIPSLVLLALSLSLEKKFQ